MGNVEIPKWLKHLPLAPEFRPTDTEFADPIAYISKIEKEVGAFGICKVIPPLPKPSKKYVFNNLNKSLSKCRESGLDANSGELGGFSKKLPGDKNVSRAVFTTRQQELGQDAKRSRAAVDVPHPVAQKQVWQSGEFYTIGEFESKSKAFSRSVLGVYKEVTPLVVEALFWKAALEKPMYVEYANDVPGSGFGEPEGFFRYFNARKKRRRICTSSDRGGRSYGRQQGVNDVGKVEVKPLISSELGKECIDSPPNKTPLPVKESGQCSNAEVEGTAGWKLSNCPWNLQVIARSAGSLTRFMLDDIPGVTSPMVYIGMLFSWFAWHVEDHELHSLNFLHTGSPKTWYAVPGEYAFAFEDVIRKQAFGDVDHLAALKILGEKTTLLSPEIVVASGIPCCRLVQNPGEFVVTFPRAYHIGFSHGFNCGEAANFGTPQWLTIAKEAAVRRAAMDHLPMLSHQQLLYLLTMSFISRIPRTILPGVRSSRSKNRLKEERELLVKKAFIEDLLKENRLLHTILRKDSAFRAVLWHPDLLPSLARDSLSQNETTLDAALIKDAEMSVPLHKAVNQDFRDLSPYINPLNDLYLDNNDVLCEFQVDSGTLVCVACGILGYPIMSVVQPSKKASMGISCAKNISITGAVNSPQQRALCHIQDSNKFSFSEFNNGETWDTSGFLRPRIFCLEHAVKIEELLRPKGGAKMLVICHSDYQKIKTNAAAVAEELRTTLNYNEVRLDSASQEELNLIDIALDDEQFADCQEDWTSKLGINLRFSVKTRKGGVPKKIEHALNIDHLLSIMAPVSRISNIKWCYRKSRTKRESNHRTFEKCCDGNLSKDEMIPVSNSMKIKEKVLLQYSRRKYRCRNSTREKYASGCSMACSTDVTDTDFGKINDSDDKDTSRAFCFKNAEVNCEESNTSEKHFVVQEEVEASEASTLPVSDKTEVVVMTSSFFRIAGVNEDSNQTNEDSNAVNCSTSPSLALSDAGISSGAGENMRGDNGCTAKASVLTTICSPEELTDEQDGGDIRISSTGCAFSTAVTPELTGSSVLEDSCIKLEVYGRAAFNLTDNLGESEACKFSSSTCTDSTPALEVDRAVCPRNNLPDISQTGVRDSSLLNMWEEKDEKFAQVKMTCGDRRKRSRKVELPTGMHNSFVRGPCEGLRPRKNIGTSVNTFKSNVPEMGEESSPTKKLKKCSGSSISYDQVHDNRNSLECNLEGCRMRFRTRAELLLHKHNQCHHKQCGKRFRSHKYVVLHQRVHDNERPLKCTWTGCTMTFKWAWARTEHFRLHTGERPYKCKIKGCGLTFRFVSDFSRHRRKTGHYVSPPPK